MANPRQECIKKLKELGIEVNETTILVMMVLMRYKQRRNFWKDVNHFYIAARIGTAELEYNSADEFSKALNGRYKIVFSAFQNWRERWFGEKLEWKDALSRAGVEYKPRNISWSQKRATREIQEKGIRNWNDLETKSPRLHQKIKSGKLGTLRSLIIAAGLEPTEPKKREPVKPKKKKLKTLLEKAEPTDSLYCKKCQKLLRPQKIDGHSFGRCRKCKKLYVIKSSAKR